MGLREPCSVGGGWEEPPRWAEPRPSGGRGLARVMGGCGQQPQRGRCPGRATRRGAGLPRGGQLGHFSPCRKRMWPSISGAPQAGGHVTAAGTAQWLWLVPAAAGRLRAGADRERRLLVGALQPGLEFVTGPLRVAPCPFPLPAPPPAFACLPPPSGDDAPPFPRGPEAPFSKAPAGHNSHDTPIPLSAAFPLRTTPARSLARPSCLGSPFLCFLGSLSAPQPRPSTVSRCNRCLSAPVLPPCGAYRVRH